MIRILIVAFLFSSPGNSMCAARESLVLDVLVLDCRPLDVHAVWLEVYAQFGVFAAEHPGAAHTYPPPTQEMVEALHRSEPAVIVTAEVVRQRRFEEIAWSEPLEKTVREYALIGENSACGDLPDRLEVSESVECCDTLPPSSLSCATSTPNLISLDRRRAYEMPD